MSVNNKCPRCDNPGIKAWEELNDEEREVVKRLPASADYTLEERKTSHRWCTRCWYENLATDEQG
jgi:alpha-ketoglutarate-dependent taurine dioxygenase